MEHCNGGVELLLEHIHAKANYRLPLKNMAYILYNMTFKGIYDPLVYSKFEANYKTASTKYIDSRTAFGGVYAYYKSN
jgi:hypothetical protein